LKYYIIAGEASGDLHGAGLMEALLQCDSAAEFRVWGGEKMAAVGGTLVKDYREGAVMGLVEVLRKAGTVRSNLNLCKTDIEAWKPDVVILIDYPGFNLRIAEFAKKKGFRVYWYIAPKVWATRERRVRKLIKYVDRLFVIFPFEPDYFCKHGIEAFYAGNPLVDMVASQAAAAETAEEFLDRNGLPHKPYIALLPGSRKMEVSHTMPVFLQLEKLMAARGLSQYQLVVAAAPSIDDPVYASYLSDSSIKVVREQTYSVLSHATAAVVDSGTASLEAALLDVPQVVVYHMNPLSFMMVRILLKTKYVSLANLILDKPIFDELLQENFTVKKVFARVERLVGDESYRSAMRADYAKLRTMLGGSGASMRVAREMVDSLKASFEE
jgi:lipid-A-disaccharide synthase